MTVSSPALTGDELVRLRQELWSFDRIQELSNIFRWVASESQRELLRVVIDSVIEIRAEGRLEARHLRAFEAAMRHGSIEVYGPAAKRLAVCSRFFPEAGERLVALAKDSRWLVRRNAILAMAYRPEQGVTLRLAELGLSDRSAVVRKHAAHHCLSLGLGDAVPFLAAAVLREDDKVMRTSLRYTHKLIRDGAVIENGWITYLTNTGAKSCTLTEFARLAANE